MKIKELISILKEYPEDMEVLSGVEEDINPIIVHVVDFHEDEESDDENYEVLLNNVPLPKEHIGKQFLEEDCLFRKVDFDKFLSL